MKMNNRLKKLNVIFLCSFALLMGCQHTAPNKTEDPIILATIAPKATLAEGKASFLAKNYKLAYQQLLPLAEGDNPDAQYAVGYMLYYGKGITRDDSKARFWMAKAADQGQPAAKKAIMMI